jgi:hypothetical protein
MCAAESRTLEMIDEVIADLAQRQTMLSEFVSSTLGDVESGVDGAAVGAAGRADGVADPAGAGDAGWLR